MANLESIEGIGGTYADKLKLQNISSIEELLERGKTPQGRKDLAQKTGIGDGNILNWINRADLARVKGIGGEYADLLECAGVNTVPDLARRNPHNLYEKLVAINSQKNLVRKTPTLEQVEQWIACSRQLPPIISY